MSRSKVAKRYAQGLLDFAKEANNTDVLYNEMKDVVKILSDSKDLVRFLAIPFIDHKKKIEVAKEVFKNFSLATLNFIKLVISRGREGYLYDIAQEFVDKVDRENGVQKVILTIATQLSQESINGILKSTDLVKSTQYELELVIKPEILGGYILRVEDQQMNASVKDKLNQIKKNFQLN